MKLTTHPLSSVMFRNEWSYTSTPLCAVMAFFLRVKKQDDNINSVLYI